MWDVRTWKNCCWESLSLFGDWHGREEARSKLWEGVKNRDFRSDILFACPRRFLDSSLFSSWTSTIRIWLMAMTENTINCHVNSCWSDREKKRRVMTRAYVLLCIFKRLQIPISRFFFKIHSWRNMWTGENVPRNIKGFCFIHSNI